MKNGYPDYDYVAREKCGCVVGLMADMGDGETAKEVASFIRGGCTIERVHRSQLKEILKDGIGCHCEQPEAQPTLF